jgi:hypothetical protein
LTSSRFRGRQLPALQLWRPRRARSTEQAAHVGPPFGTIVDLQPSIVVLLQTRGERFPQPFDHQEVLRRFLHAQHKNSVGVLGVE